MIGKGTEGFGSVWAAKRIPDGHFSAHANQARIRFIFEEESKNGCVAGGKDCSEKNFDHGYEKGLIYSQDVATFAVAKQLY